MGTKRPIDSGKRGAQGQRIMVSAQQASAAGNSDLSVVDDNPFGPKPEGEPPVLEVGGNQVPWADADPWTKARSVDRPAVDADANRVAWAAVDPDPFVRAIAMRSEFATPEVLGRGLSDPDFSVQESAMGSQNITPELTAAAYAVTEEPRLKIAAMAGGGRTEQLADTALADPNPSVRRAVLSFRRNDPVAATAAQVAVGARDKNPMVAAVALDNPAATAADAEDVFRNGATQDHKLAALGSHAATEAMAEAGMRKGNRFKQAALLGGGATDAMAKKGFESKNKDVRNAAAEGPGASPATLAGVIRNHPDVVTVHKALSNTNTPTSSLNATIRDDINPHWVKAAKQNLARRDREQA